MIHNNYIHLGESVHIHIASGSFESNSALLSVAVIPISYISEKYKDIQETKDQEPQDGPNQQSEVTQQMPQSTYF